jgi:CheY-like chemotaxis protein
MEPSQSYVLIIDQESEDLHVLESLLSFLKCSVVVVNSTEQALACASQGIPYLVILIGNHPNGAQVVVNHLRREACKHNRSGVMIVALTDVHTPSWLHQDENPGFDGFLVKPISGDVLMSLVQSALARQVCYSAS